MRDALLAVEKDIDGARRALERMNSADNITDIEDHWVALLYALARVVKNLAPLKSHTILAPILKDMENDRRTPGSLASYIYQARNVRDHGLKSITERRPASTTLTNSGGRTTIQKAHINGFTLENVSIIGDITAFEFIGDSTERDKVQLSPNSKGRLSIDYHPERILLVDVYSERTGRNYPVPNYRKDGITTKDIKYLGYLAVEYYKDKYLSIKKIVNQ